MKKRNETLSHLEEIMEKNNRKEILQKSYGAVVLDNGTIISIRKYFINIKEMWKMYQENPQNEFFNTYGYIFENEDIAINIKNVKMVMNTNLRDGVLEESFEEQIKSISIMNHMLEIFPERNLEHQHDLDMMDLEENQDDEDDEIEGSV